MMFLKLDVEDKVQCFTLINNGKVLIKGHIEEFREALEKYVGLENLGDLIWDVFVPRMESRYDKICRDFVADELVKFEKSLKRGLQRNYESV